MVGPGPLLSGYDPVGALVKTITMGGSGFALAKQLIDSLATPKNGDKPTLESVPNDPA